MSHTELHVKRFVATGSAVNVDLGFIPAIAEVINASAADTEIWKLEYFNQFGDSQEIWHYMINNDGGDDVDTPVKKSSSGYIAEYDTSAVGKQKSCTFDDTAGAAEDLITCTVTTDVPSNGDVVKFVESGGLPTNLDELTSYYVIDSETYGAGTFRVSTTSPQKGAQSAKDFGSDGTPANYFVNESKMEPVNTGGKGITISASFASDGDILYVKAFKAETDTNDGDAANW
jgi:hypothetical protein